MECERLVILDLDPSWSLIVGRVLAMHVRDDAVMDPAKLDVTGRMHGRGLYARTRDSFDMPRIIGVPASPAVSAVPGRDGARPGIRGRGQRRRVPAPVATAVAPGCPLPRYP